MNIMNEEPLVNGVNMPFTRVFSLLSGYLLLIFYRERISDFTFRCDTKKKRMLCGGLYAWNIVRTKT